MATLSSIGINLAGSLAVFGVALSAFGCAVRSQSTFVAARCSARPPTVIYNPNKNRHRSQDRGHPMLGWIPWVMGLTYDTMLRGVPGTGTRDGGLSGALLKVNLDGIVLLRFHHLCLRVCVLAATLYLLVILPIYKTARCSNFTGDLDTEECLSSDMTDYERLSLANIPALDPIEPEHFGQTVRNGFLPGHEGFLARLYAIVFCTWVITYYTLRELQVEWGDVLAMRRVYYLEADHWGDRNEELNETLLRIEEEMERQQSVDDGEKDDVDDEEYLTHRKPWIPHPEQPDTVPNIELYSILVGGLPILPTEIVNQDDDIEAVFSRKQSIDWQLAVTTAFFDHCVPNQPGFSSSIAAVTILPSADQLTEAWASWYRAAGKLRRLRFIRREIARRRRKMTESPMNGTADIENQKGNVQKKKKRLVGRFKKKKSKASHDHTEEKKRYYQELLGTSDDLEVENKLLFALDLGPEQTSAYSRELAVGAANLAPHGWNENRVRAASLPVLLEMEKAAMAEVQEANAALRLAQEHIAADDGESEVELDLSDGELKALLENATSGLPEASTLDVNDSYSAPLKSDDRTSALTRGSSGNSNQGSFHNSILSGKRSSTRSSSSYGDSSSELNTVTQTADELVNIGYDPAVSDSTTTASAGLHRSGSMEFQRHDEDSQEGSKRGSLLGEMGHHVREWTGLHRSCSTEDLGKLSKRKRRTQKGDLSSAHLPSNLGLEAGLFKERSSLEAKNPSSRHSRGSRVSLGPPGQEANEAKNLSSRHSRGSRLNLGSPGQETNEANNPSSRHSRGSRVNLGSPGQEANGRPLLTKKTPLTRATSEITPHAPAPPLAQRATSAGLPVRRIVSDGEHGSCFVPSGTTEEEQAQGTEGEHSAPVPSRDMNPAKGHSTSGRFIESGQSRASEKWYFSGEKREDMVKRSSSLSSQSSSDSASWDPSSDTDSTRSPQATEGDGDDLGYEPAEPDDKPVRRVLRSLSMSFGGSRSGEGDESHRKRGSLLGDMSSVGRQMRSWTTRGMAKRSQSSDNLERIMKRGRRRPRKGDLSSVRLPSDLGLEAGLFKESSSKTLLGDNNHTAHDDSKNTPRQRRAFKRSQSAPLEHDHSHETKRGVPKRRFKEVVANSTILTSEAPVPHSSARESETCSEASQTPPATGTTDFPVPSQIGDPLLDRAVLCDLNGGGAGQGGLHSGLQDSLSESPPLIEDDIHQHAHQANDWQVGEPEVDELFRLSHNGSSLASCVPKVALDSTLDRAVSSLGSSSKLSHDPALKVPSTAGKHEDSPHESNHEKTPSDSSIGKLRSDGSVIDVSTESVPPSIREKLEEVKVRRQRIRDRLSSIQQQKQGPTIGDCPTGMQVETPYRRVASDLTNEASLADAGLLSSMEGGKLDTSLIGGIKKPEIEVAADMLTGSEGSISPSNSMEDIEAPAAQATEEGAPTCEKDTSDKNEENGARQHTTEAHEAFITGTTQGSECDTESLSSSTQSDRYCPPKFQAPSIEHLSFEEILANRNKRLLQISGYGRESEVPVPLTTEIPKELEDDSESASSSNGTECYSPPKFHMPSCAQHSFEDLLSNLKSKEDESTITDQHRLKNTEVQHSESYTANPPQPENVHGSPPVPQSPSRIADHADRDSERSVSDILRDEQSEDRSVYSVEEDEHLKMALDFQEKAGLRHRGNAMDASTHNVVQDTDEKWAKVTAIVQESSRDQGTRHETKERMISSGRWTFPGCRSILRALCSFFSSMWSWGMLRFKPPEIVDDLVRDSSYAVVTFTSRQAAVAARHCLADSRGHDRWVTLNDIPSPPLADAPAGNMSSFRGCVRPVTLTISDKQKLIRNNLATAALVAIYFFYTIPLTLAEQLVSPKSLSKILPAIEEWQEQSDFLANLFTGFIPALVWTAFFAACPPMFKTIANFGSNATSSVTAENSALQYFWWFMVISAFTGISLQAAVLDGFDEGLSIGAEILAVIKAAASLIPTTISATWLNWMIVRVFAVMPTQYLLQLNTFMFWCLRLRCCARTVRGGGAGGPVPYRIYVDSGVVMLCVFALAPAAPLIAPAALAYFLCCTPLLRWTMIFLYKPRFDVGGGRFPFIFDICVSGMVVGQILLTAMMTQKFAVGPAFAAFCPIIPTVWFRYFVRRRFLRPFMDAALLQTSLLDGWDTHDETSSEKREEFRQFLVDCHKAAYVPVCIAGDESTTITSEPAVVIAVETDKDLELIPEEGETERSSLSETLPTPAPASKPVSKNARRATMFTPYPHQPGQMMRRTSLGIQLPKENATVQHGRMMRRASAVPLRRGVSTKGFLGESTGMDGPKANPTQSPTRPPSQRAQSLDIGERKRGNPQ